MVEKTAEGFGASHTSFYTNVKAKDSYATLDDILNSKVKDEGVRGVTKEVLDACVGITEALRVNLVTVADAQNSVFGDVQLGVDVIADDIMWKMARSSKLVRQASSEEEPVMVDTNPNGRFTICWDPLDGSSIVDNNWAVGTIVGIWDKTTGMLGATGRDQVTSIVVLYGPRTTALVACDDGVYEFTCGAGNKWFASRERIQIKKVGFSDSALRTRTCMLFSCERMCSLQASRQSLQNRREYITSRINALGRRALDAVQAGLVARGSALLLLLQVAFMGVADI